MRVLDGGIRETWYCYMKDCIYTAGIFFFFCLANCGCILIQHQIMGPKIPSLFVLSQLLIKVHCLVPQSNTGTVSGIKVSRAVQVQYGEGMCKGTQPSAIHGVRQRDVDHSFFLCYSGAIALVQH